MNIEEQATNAKRTDVGYKRPPAEHQFKSGNQASRRKKLATKPPTMLELIIRILKEEQRVEINGTVRWVTNARLIIMVAFSLAEKGNPSLSRALLDLLLRDTDSAELNESWLQIQHEDGSTTTRTMSGAPVDYDAFINGSGRV